MTINMRSANLYDANAIAKVHHDSFHAVRSDYMPDYFFAQLPEILYQAGF